MNAQSATPRGTNSGTRQIEGNSPQPSTRVAVFNSLESSPKSYDELVDDVRSDRPRLLPDAVDRVLWQLIKMRAVRPCGGLWFLSSRSTIDGREFAIGSSRGCNYERRDELARNQRRANEAVQARYYAWPESSLPNSGSDDVSTRRGSSAEIRQMAEGSSLSVADSESVAEMAFFGKAFAAAHFASWQRVSHVGVAA